MRLRSLRRRETTSSIVERRKQVFKRALITSWIQNSPFHCEQVTYRQKLRCFLSPIRWPRPVILIRRLVAKLNEEINFSLEATKFCLVLRSTPAVPTQTVFTLRMNTFLVGKVLLLFHQMTALSCVLIFFHVKMKWPCYKIKLRSAAFLKFLFKLRLKRETNLMQACSANQHQVIMPSWLPKVPSWWRKNALCLSQSAFSNFSPHVINADNNFLK